MAHVVQEDRQYQRILLSDDSEAKLEEQGFEPLFSSNVSAAAQRGKDLIIRFHNGSIYKYPEQGKNYLQLIAAASHGKWVWRFLRRPQVPYMKIGSLPLPEDTLESDEDIIKPRISTYEVKAIVPKDYMTTGELPRISIQPIKMVDAQLNPTTTIAGKPINTLVDMQKAVTTKTVVRDFVESDFKVPSLENRLSQAKKWNIIDDDIKKAVANYSKGDYETINGYLRKDTYVKRLITPKMEKELKIDIDKIKQVTSQELGEDSILYRNMYSVEENLFNQKGLEKLTPRMKANFFDYLNTSEFEMKESMGNKEENNLFDSLLKTLKGTTFKDEAFISTTMNKEVADKEAFGNIKLNIFAPKKTKGAIIETLSQVKNEDEVLLNAGTKFKIIDIYKPKDSHIPLVIDVEVEVD